MMQIYQTYKLESARQDSIDEDNEEMEDAVADPWEQVVPQEELSTSSPMRVKNWRQLFDEEELNMAYQNSI